MSVSGELDIASVPAFDAALRRACAQTPIVELDLQALEFMDGCAAQLVLAADRRARRTGGRLSIVRCPAEVERLFGLLGIDRELELVRAPCAPRVAGGVAAGIAA